MPNEEGPAGYDPNKAFDEMLAKEGHGVEDHGDCFRCNVVGRVKAERTKCVQFVHNFRREAHDYGLEAFPDKTWELLEQVENKMREL